MWLLRFVTSTVSLFLIVFTIPLAFDVGGRECGLAFSFALGVFYFLYSSLQSLTPPKSHIRFAFGTLVGSTQWLTILALLIWSLNKFSVDSKDATWTKKNAWAPFLQHNRGLVEWIFGRHGALERMTIGGWDTFLQWSSPVFQILEGFCTLIVIQAAGLVTRWLVNREKADTWMILLLGLSAGIFSSSIYFLWRATTFPDIENTSAIFMGSTVTFAIILASWGIVSGRGSPIESSLLFAYITLCIYQIFAENARAHHLDAQDHMTNQPALPPLPSILLASYTTIMHALSTLPVTIHHGFSLLSAAVMTITPSVIISLAYRVFVMYLSARIIPAIQTHSDFLGAESIEQGGKLLRFLVCFSPSILVAVYTSLLIQHFSAECKLVAPAGPRQAWSSRSIYADGKISGWANVVFTMLFYAVELYLGSAYNDGTFAGHWKTD